MGTKGVFPTLPRAASQYHTGMNPHDGAGLRANASASTQPPLGLSGGQMLTSCPVETIHHSTVVSASRLSAENAGTNGRRCTNGPSRTVCPSRTAPNADSTAPMGLSTTAASGSTDSPTRAWCQSGCMGLFSGSGLTGLCVTENRPATARLHPAEKTQQNYPFLSFRDGAGVSRARSQRGHPPRTWTVTPRRCKCTSAPVPSSVTVAGPWGVCTLFRSRSAFSAASTKSAAAFARSVSRCRCSVSFMGVVFGYMGLSQDRRGPRSECASVPGSMGLFSRSPIHGVSRDRRLSSGSHRICLYRKTMQDRLARVVLQNPGATIPANPPLDGGNQHGNSGGVYGFNHRLRCYHLSRCHLRAHGCSGVSQRAGKPGRPDSLAGVPVDQLARRETLAVV